MDAQTPGKLTQISRVAQCEVFGETNIKVGARSGCAELEHPSQHPISSNGQEQTVEGSVILTSICSWGDIPLEGGRCVHRISLLSIPRCSAEPWR